MPESMATAIPMADPSDNKNLFSPMKFVGAGAEGPEMRNHRISRVPFGRMNSLTIF
jgi:hypothetical protein